MTQTDDLLGADTSELTMLGQQVDRLEGERPQLECFTTKTNLTRETHRTREWVSLPPGPHQRPDVYEVTIVYAPRAAGSLRPRACGSTGYRSRPPPLLQKRSPSGPLATCWPRPGPTGCRLAF
jgi:hypothetical protein